MRNKHLLTLALSVAVLVAIVPLGYGAGHEDVFTFVTYQETMTFDPAKSVDETELANVFNTYDPLVYPVKGKAPKPWVAKSWDISEDGKTYTFTIRKGIKFHDGTELTAEDVAFSMVRMLRINQGFAWLWSDILKPEGVEATGEYEVQFELKKTFGPFIPTLVQFNILNKDLIMEKKKDGEFGKYGDYGQEYLQTNDAGSGPYKVGEVTLGNRIVFNKFDDYWKGWEEDQVDKAIWRVIPERSTMDTLLKEGSIDMIDQWGTPEEYAALDEHKNIRSVADPNVQLYLHHMNNKKKPLDDVKVRKAISYAFDYETAVQDLFKGGKQAQGPVPILMPGHNSDVKVYHQNIEKAKKLIKESSYSMEELKDMKLTYVYVTGNELERKLGLLMRNNLAKIGLNVELKKAVWGRMTDMASKAETTPHFMAVFHTAKYPSPDSHTYVMFNPNAWGTYISCSWYKNPKVTKLSREARTTVDREKRYELYGKVQEIVTEEAAGLFIANPVHRVAMRERV